MTLLHLLSFAGAASAFVFLTLSLASGLLWISELIEEHSRQAKVVGQRAIYVIILVHFLLYFYDSLPLKHILFSVLCHIVYLQNFTPTWPFISLSSSSFVASCVLVVADHFLWFFYFARITQEARHRAHRAYRGPPLSHAVPNFGDIATFFGVCVWLAPLFLFLSLSANDNALPTNASSGDQPLSPSKPVATPGRTSLFKALYDMLPLESLPRLRPRSRRRDSEGIIAPRSPTGPPPVSPVLGAISNMNLPSPLLSPRRVSSEAFRPLSRPGSPSFTLSPPPKRAIADESTREGQPLGGRRMEIRNRGSYGTGSTVDS